MIGRQTLSVGDLFDLENGFAFKSKDFIDEGVPVIKIKNVKAGFFSEHEFSYVSEKFLSERANKLAKPHDLLISMSGNRHDGSPETWVGKVAFFDRKAHYFLNQRVGALRLKVQNKANVRFLGYLLSSFPYQEQFIAIATSSGGQANLSPAQILGAEIEIPTIEEQREIAATLGALDDKIELNRKMAATLEEMARALYRSWFVDFDPVHGKAAGRAPAHMDTQTADLFPDSFREDGLPSGWKASRLGDLLTLNYGKALKRSLRESGPFPVYGSGGTDSTHSQAVITDPTIIVGRKGTVGSVMWEPRGCWPIDTTFFVTSDLPMSFSLRTLEHLPLSDMNTDAAVPGLNRENAYRLEVPLPGAEIIALFSGMAGIWQDKIDQIRTENQTLANLRDTLLPRLMSGELRVGETKEQVEAVA